MSQTLPKMLLWGFWAANFLIILSFWASNTGAQLLSGELSPFIAFGRLAGLLAIFCALTQLLLMSRSSWLEPVFGMDKLARAHRLNGYATYLLALSHAPLLALGYSSITGNSLIEQQMFFIQMVPYVPLAVLALLLLTVVVGLSIYIVRRHLRFETWYYVHLFAYGAVALIPFHALTNGSDLVTNPIFANYWLGAYVFVGITLFVWRFGMPLYRFFAFGFVIEKIIPEAPRATSVYITGRNLQEFRALGGQFVLVRFLTKGMWWQEHPFSLSMLPDSQHFRLTIRQLGDFTNSIPNLKPGTKVIVSGPHGAFTHRQAIKQKTLYIAGGVGITPIRALLEEQAKQAKQARAIMLYGNRSQEEIIFKTELEGLANKLHMPLHHVLSDDAQWAGEKGFIDQEKLARLVPDITERDVFLCGPPPMMTGIIKALEALCVPKAQVHYERFALLPK